MLTKGPADERSTADERTAPTLIFMHIPKTGGVTMRRVIERNYGPEERFELKIGPDGALAGTRSQRPAPAGTPEPSPQIGIRRLAMLPAERKQRLRIVYGHTIFGVHEELPGPSAYVTMVREPTAWVLSSYRYLRERSQHRLHESVRKLSLEEFVRTEIAGRDNLQTRMISGRFSEQDPCSKATLELAKRNIDEHFAALGLTERFDETVLLWGQVLGWRKLHYVPRNVTTRGPGGSIPPDVVRLILRVNEFDQQLYRFVVQRFEEQLARHPSVAGDLARFGRQNALFQHLRRARPRRILRRVKRAVLP